MGWDIYSYDDWVNPKEPYYSSGYLVSYGAISRGANYISRTVDVCS